MSVTHRIVTLTENVNGYPQPVQFPSGDIESWDIVPPHSDGTRFFIGYGGINPNWSGGGERARYLAYKHSSGLYCLFFGPGPGDFRIGWAEAAPRNGLRGKPYCNKIVHGWREFRCSGWDNTDPENPVWVQERLQRFGAGIQPPPYSTVTPETPWIIGAYEIHEIIPSVAHTISGFDLPEYMSRVSEPTNGDELD